MEGKLTLHIEFLDGRTHDETIAMSYPPGSENAACMKLLADFNMMGGLLKCERNAVSLIPISTMKKVEVSASAVVTGDAFDLANLTLPSQAKRQ